MENSLPPGFKLDDSGQLNTIAQNSTAPSESTSLPEGFQLDSEKYGGASNEALAAAAGAARSLTLSGSDWALTKSGLVKPETLQGIQDENPKASFAGEVAGLAAAHFYGVGEAEDAINAAKLGLKAARATGNAAEIAKATEAYSTVKNTMSAGDLLNPIKAISKVGGNVSEALGGGAIGSIAGTAAEGGVFGAANTSTEAALGDPDLAAEHLMGNIGVGALYGAGISTALGLGIKGIKSLPKAIGAASDIMSSAANKVKEIIGDNANKEIPIIDAQPKSGVQPTSIDDLISRNAKAIENGEAVDMPQKQALETAASRVALENPVHPLQIDSLSSQGERDAYKLVKELPGEAGDALRGYEARQKAELLNKTDEAIESLSEKGPTSDAVEGGSRAADAFTQVIEGNRKELGAKISELKNVDGKYFHLPGIIESITSSDSPYGNPKLANMFDTSGKEINLKPWDSGMGIEKKTYSNVRDMVNALKKDPENFSRLFDIRKAVTSGINVMESGDASRELTKVKAAMMDYIQSVVQKEAPDVKVRDFFKRYAVNEENAKIIEKKFGAEIGSDNFRSAAKNKPQEKILDNIFRDTESVKAAKKILNPEQFDDMLANHLAEQRARVTQDGVFSSNKFNTYLRGNQDALNEAFSDRPDQLQKLKDLNTIMRILPDTQSINPSGTAKTLLGALRGHSVTDVLNNIKEYGFEKWSHQQTLDALNKKLAGESSKVTAIENAKNIAQKASNNISKNIDSILYESKTPIAFVGAKLTADKYKDEIKKISALANNPNNLLNTVAKSTDPIYQHAPNLSASVQKSMMNGISFLNSKIPPQPNVGPFAKPQEPSDAQIASFNRYYSAVHDPIGTLASVKDGTFSKEQMESLQAVYPKMYDEMKSNIIQHVTEMKDPSTIPYKTKLSLSNFLGESVHPSLLPQSIASNQMVYAQAAQNSGGPKKSTVKGMSDMKIASQYSLRPDNEA